MYDVNQEGDNYFEVFLDFVEELLERWKELDVTHYLTVVFFCRTHFCCNKVSCCGRGGVTSGDALSVTAQYGVVRFIRWKAPFAI